MGKVMTKQERDEKVRSEIKETKWTFIIFSAVILFETVYLIGRDFIYA